MVGHASDDLTGSYPSMARKTIGIDHLGAIFFKAG